MVKPNSDMGVHVTDTLKAIAHCQIAVRKASAAVRLLKLAFCTLKISNLKLPCTIYVCPHIQYFVQAAGPFLINVIKVLGLGVSPA